MNSGENGLWASASEVAVSHSQRNDCGGKRAVDGEDQRIAKTGATCNRTGKGDCEYCNPTRARFNHRKAVGIKFALD